MDNAIAWWAGAGRMSDRAIACSSPLKIASRWLGATPSGVSAGEGPTLRASRAARACLAALAVAGMLVTGSASAKSSGERGEPAPAVKVVNDALTYSNFAGECSQTAFVVNATGNLAVVGGPVSGPGSTTLDGLPYDTYELDLKTGPATFVTKFDRVFPAPLPSATYEMVFTTRVMLGGVEQGVSITTIRCTNGVVSARNRAIPSTPMLVPVGGPLMWLALSLLLAASALTLVPVRRR
ncbi:MAG: hypothetical protein AMXMBFR42_10180 [Burkholderiales bacterium]